MSNAGPARDDDDLIRRSLEGDTGAFGELVCQYQDRLYNSLVHFLRNESEAEDVAQEAFILAWSRLESFRGNSSFYTWLYRIAFNSAISRRRRGRSHVSVERDLVEAGAALDSLAPPPDARLDQDERTAELMAAMARLNEEHRFILLLREMDGLSYEEIAEILDTPVGTVRSRLHRARAQLKEELAGYFQNES